MYVASEATNFYFLLLYQNSVTNLFNQIGSYYCSGSYYSQFLSVM